MSGRSRATLVGCVAILLWSLLALFTVGSAPVPPLLLNTITFAIGAAVGLVWVAASGGFGQLRDVGWRVYALGTAGLFGYHLLYFTALRLAPPAEAGLICYLWPLAIVLFSGLLPGERITAGHIAGALVAFSGVALIVLGRGVTADGTALPGFGLAFLCALTWAGYSVLSRRMGEVPTAAVTVFCVMTSLLSGIAHLAVEETVWPVGAAGWLSVVALGVGPVGLAFYVWDVGVKKGDIQLLGVLSYGAPLLSTLVLVGAGVAEATASLVLAAVLIVAGAALAAGASARLRRSGVRRA